MRQSITWFWQRGILSTFLAGLFALLPIVITIGIIVWAGGLLKEWLGPQSFVGQALSQMGLRFVTDPTVASVLSWVAVLLAVWLLGALLKSVGKRRIERAFHAAMERIPLVNVLYGPVAQIVYVPTSPLPMSGLIVFAAADSVQQVEMKVDDLMKICLSIGVMSSKVSPDQYVVPLSGRVLRALLATQMEYTRATHIAASTGQAMALLFGFLGFLFNPFLLFIALFVWIGAAQEASMAQMKSSLGGIPVLRAMITDFRILAPADPLSRAVEQILAGSQEDFPVVEQDRVVGILTRQDLIVGLAQHGRDTSVGDAMQREFQTVDAAEMLDASFRRLQSCQCHTLPVLRRGELVGLVTMDNVGEFVAIQAAEKDLVAAGKRGA